MSTPTYEEMLKGTTTWKGSHHGIGYLLSHHGHRRGDEYEHAAPYPGTWCYYLLIPEQMLPHRWQDFACIRSDSGFEQAGPAWDNVNFNSGITWSSSEPYWDRKTARQWDASKVGCDYAHLWHCERGYLDTFSSVEFDAKRTVESFIEAAPDRLVRSQYSGVWASPAEFYTARNGSLVHQSDAIDPQWSGWLRPEEPTP
jgi:hypothetical protein